VFINKNKLTTNVAKEVRFCLEEEEARQFKSVVVVSGGGVNN